MGSNFKKTLITYVYFETELAFSNINFFIHNGVFYNNNVQYNFIIKGKKCSVKFPEYKNIKVIKMKNKGYDFGGYSNSLNFVNKKDFDYYIFLNDTVIGPFIPRYISKNLWYKNFTGLISDKVKLIGSAINRKKFYDVPEHVQSMAFATDNIGLKLLIDSSIFDLKKNIGVYENKGKDGIIRYFEVGMTKVIIDNGYEIASFMQIDNYNKKVKHGNIFLTHSAYFGTTINPIEIMFIKNKQITNTIIRNYITWNESPEEKKYLSSESKIIIGSPKKGSPQKGSSQKGSSQKGSPEKGSPNVFLGSHKFITNKIQKKSGKLDNKKITEKTPKITFKLSEIYNTRNLQ